MMETVLTIGKLADAAGVNIETIATTRGAACWMSRLNHSVGIGAMWPEQAKRAIHQRAQALGFTLDEVAALTLDVDARPWRDSGAGRTQLGLIEQKIADLAAMQGCWGTGKQCDVRTAIRLVRSRAGQD